MLPSLVFLWQALRFRVQQSLKNTFGSSSSSIHYSSGAVKLILHCKSSTLNSTGIKAGGKKYAILTIWQEEKSREGREMSNCGNTFEWKRSMFLVRVHHVGLIYCNIDE